MQVFGLPGHLYPLRRSSVAFHAPPLAQAGRAAQPASPSGAGPEPPRRRSGGGRAAPPRLSDVGQGQARAAPARRGLCRLRRHGRPHPRPPRQARASSSRCPTCAHAQGRARRPNPSGRTPCACPGTVRRRARRPRPDSTPSPSASPRPAHIKQFTAYDPIAKWTVAKPFNRATAKAAADLPRQAHRRMPFPVKAIQVDGGCEFMAEFEAGLRRAKGLALYVLPPQSPELNGAVERCNGAWRYEFYACRDLPLTIPEIAKHVACLPAPLQHHRPHGALAGLTPKQYLDQPTSRQNPRRLICPEPGHKFVPAPAIG